MIVLRLALELTSGYRGAAPSDARAVGRLARVAALRSSLLRSHGGDSRVSAGRRYRGDLLEDAHIPSAHDQRDGIRSLRRLALVISVAGTSRQGSALVSALAVSNGDHESRSPCCRMSIGPGRCFY